MRFVRLSALVSAAVLALPGVAFPQDFEGVIRERNLDLDDQDLFNLLWADAEDEPEFDTETEWFRYAAATLFEIPIERILEDAGVDAGEITMWVKGSKVRYSEASAGSAGPYGVFDWDDMTFSMVMPETRSYFQYTMDEVESANRDMMESMGIDPDEIADMGDYELEDESDMGGVWLEPTVRPLNRTEEVNGMRASAFHAEAGRDIGLGWCAEDVTGMRDAMAKMAARMAQLGDHDESDDGPSAEDLLCEAKLPVRVQILTFDGMGGGLHYSVNEILTLERTSVDDGLFQIPEGYTLKSLSDMWR